MASIGLNEPLFRMSGGLFGPGIFQRSHPSKGDPLLTVGGEQSLREGFSVWTGSLNSN